MANEAQVRVSFQVRSGNVQYSPQPTGYSANIPGPASKTTLKGPSPGLVNARPNHTEPNFSALTKPGLCRVLNQDPVATVTYGVYSSHYRVFLPVGDLLPGEFTVIRLSAYLGEDLVPGTGTGTGTGTPGAFTNAFSIKASGLPLGQLTAPVLVDAFEA